MDIGALVGTPCIVVGKDLDKVAHRIAYPFPDQPAFEELH